MGGKLLANRSPLYHSGKLSNRLGRSGLELLGFKIILLTLGIAVLHQPVLEGGRRGARGTGNTLCYSYFGFSLLTDISRIWQLVAKE